MFTERNRETKNAVDMNTALFECCNVKLIKQSLIHCLIGMENCFGLLYIDNRSINWKQSYIYIYVCVTKVN